MNEPARAGDRAYARLQLAFAASQMGIGEGYLATVALEWSPETFAVLGVDGARLRGTSDDFARLVHPDDWPRIEPHLRRALERGGPVDFELRIVLDDGTIRGIHNLATVERDYDGRPLRLVGTVRDVTARTAGHELTGYTHDDDRRRSSDVGFAAHLVKPVDSDALLAVIGGGEGASP